MNKEDITTPISNYIFNSGNRELIDKYVFEHLSIIPQGMSSLQHHKQKLGKQKYCWTGHVKNWVWESDCWRLYVSKEGASLEVLRNLTLEQAIAAWKDYYSKVK